MLGIWREDIRYKDHPNTLPEPWHVWCIQYCTVQYIGHFDRSVFFHFMRLLLTSDCLEP